MDNERYLMCSYGWVVAINIPTIHVDNDEDDKLTTLIEFNEYNEVPIFFSNDGTLAFLDCNSVNNEEIKQYIVGDYFGNIQYLFDYLDSFEVEYDKTSVQPYFSNWIYDEQEGSSYCPVYDLTSQYLYDCGTYRCSLNNATSSKE